jgi:hypothetical protein
MAVSAIGVCGRLRTGAHEVGRAFGDRVDGGVGVGGDAGGHHGSVGHAQAADAAHAQLRVDDGRLVGADPAGSGVVAVGAQVLVQVRRPRRPRSRRRNRTGDRAGSSWR